MSSVHELTWHPKCQSGFDECSISTTEGEFMALGNGEVQGVTTTQRDLIGLMQPFLLLSVFANGKVNATAMIEESPNSKLVNSCSVWLDGSVAYEARTINLVLISSKTLVMATIDAFTPACSEQIRFGAERFRLPESLGPLGKDPLSIIPELIHRQ